MSNTESNPLRVYLSYAHQDRKRVDRALRPAMRKAGIEIQDFRHPIRTTKEARQARTLRGKELQESILGAIASADGYVVALSIQAIKLKYVQEELNFALRNLKQRVIVVTLDQVDFETRWDLEDVASLTRIDWYKNEDAMRQFAEALQDLRSDGPMIVAENARRALDAHWPSLAKNVDVLGADVGFKETQGQPTKTVAIRIYVRSKTPRNWLARSRDKFPLPVSLDGVPVDVLVRRFS
jgi:folylpolyglutamate synthase/dihydropteroate synthase